MITDKNENGKNWKTKLSYFSYSVTKSIKNIYYLWLYIVIKPA